MTIVNTHFKHNKMIMISHHYLENELILNRLMYFLIFLIIINFSMTNININISLKYQHITHNKKLSQCILMKIEKCDEHLNAKIDK